MRRKPLVKLSTSVGYHHSASVNRLYLMSDDVQNCSPLCISALFYGYLKLLKATRKKKSKEVCEVTPGNRTRNLLHRGRALTNCANPFPALYF